MAGYINIHTHHLTKDDNVFIYNNRFGFDKDLFSGKYFSVGVHPWDAGMEINQANFEKLMSNQNCLAIGECGLDKLKGPDPGIQKMVFQDQLQLGVKYQKPVIIHCVKAFDELLEVCAPFREVPKIIHGFNKSAQLAKQLIDAGFYLSMNDTILKKEDFDFSVVPINKLFLETDMNPLISIEEVYELTSKRFNMEIDKLKEKIKFNFTAIFLQNGR